MRLQMLMKMEKRLQKQHSRNQNIFAPPIAKQDMWLSGEKLIIDDSDQLHEGTEAVDDKIGTHD